MLSYNIKFLTCDESVSLKNVDFKTYKYETKKKSDESVYDSGKRSYCERRGGHWMAVKPRQIRKLEAIFKERTAVYCDWFNDNLIVMVFSSGAIAYLTVKPETLDVTQILFDNYIVRKMSGQCVTGVAFCKSHLLFTHTDRTATLITFGKSISSAQPCRIRDRDPHVQTIELGGSRRTERKISWCESSSGVRVLVWGSTAVEPAPWSPVLEDHANMHLYQIKGQQMSLLAYHQLENETLCAEISADNVIHIIEQTSCQKSGVTLEWSRTEAAGTTTAGGLRGPARRARCRLAAPARAAVRAACGRRALAACIDGSLHVLHHRAGLTHSARLGAVASDVRWAGSLVLAAAGARLHCLDAALQPLPHPPQLASVLREPGRVQLLAARGCRAGPLVLAACSGGPLALLQLSHPELMTAWVRSGRPANAIALLRSLDWELEGPACLRATAALLAGALRAPPGGPGVTGGPGLTGPDAAAAEARAQTALGAYLAPRVPHAPDALKYAPAVHDLARKFFHHLLRRGRIEKALSLCVDLAAADLCADARWAAARRGLRALEHEARALARAAPDSVGSDTCSQCSESDSESSASGSQPPPLPRVPLLPLPTNPADHTTTTSIRPNLHQYLEKNNTIWNTEVKDDWQRREPSIEVIPRPEPVPFRHLYQTELTEDAPNTMYRYNGYRAGSTERALKLDGYERSRPEKNKVKFSDTVTIAVVASEGSARGSVARELADSLPLCAPHRYLAAFAPLPPALPPAPPPAPAPAPGTADYVEV